jgi:parallel beta-helix repeat protein
VTRSNGTPVGSVFTALQAAVNAAPNGSSATALTRIFVQGRCTGNPTVIRNRSNLLIEGEPIPGFPAPSPEPLLEQCRPFGPRPNDLLSTIASNHGSPPSGSNGEVVKIVGGTNIRVRFLNIVDGGRNVQLSPDLLTQTSAREPHDGLEWKNSNNGVGFCNCIARNDEGLQLHGGTGLRMHQNLVIANVNGIHVRVDTRNTTIVRNRALLNRLVAPDEAQGVGIFLLEGSRTLQAFDNLACGNRDDGIALDDSDQNMVFGNRVQGNGFNASGTPISGGGGVEVRSSNSNQLDDNCITGNADQPPVAVDTARIISGSGNTGCNVTMPPACDPCTPPPDLCVP